MVVSVRLTGAISISVSIRQVLKNAFRSSLMKRWTMLDKHLRQRLLLTAATFFVCWGACHLNAQEPDSPPATATATATAFSKTVYTWKTVDGLKTNGWSKKKVVKIIHEVLDVQ